MSRQKRKGAPLGGPAPLRPTGEHPVEAKSWQRTELWWASGLLALLIAAAFWNVLFAGKSLVLTDNYNPMDGRFAAQNYGENFVPQSVWSRRGLTPYPNFHDPGATWWQWEPGGEFFRKAIRDREPPFWDPYVGAGAPSMANLTPAYFFPPYVLLVLLGNTSFLKNVYFLLLLFSAGVFTYLFLRRHELSPKAALFGAAAFMFCGDIIQNVSSFIGQTSECLPFVLFLTRWFLDRPEWRRAAVLATGYAAVALASFPPVLLAVFTFTASYALAMIWTRRAGTGETPRGTVFGRFAAAAALSIGLVAFYYLPAFFLLGAVPHASTFYKDEGVLALPLMSLYQLVAPVLMGGDLILANPPMPDPFHLHVSYVGMLSILLALFADRRTDRNGPLFVVTALAAAVVLLKLIGAAPVQWIAYLPGFNTIHFALYFGVLLNFLIAVLAAMGLDNLLAGRVSRVRVGFAAAAAALVLCGLWQIATEKGVFRHPNAGFWLRHWKFATLLALAALAAAALIAFFRPAPRARAASGLVLLGLLGVQAVFYSSYPRQYAWDVWRHPVPYVRHLMENGGFGRLLNLGHLTANTNSPFGIFNLDSHMTFNPSRAFEIYRRYVAPQSELFLRAAGLLPPEVLLDRAGIEFIGITIIRPRLVREARDRGYEQIFDDGNTLLFRRRGLPRYFFTSEYRIVDPERTLEEAGQGDRPRELLLEAPPSFSPKPNEATDPRVEVVRFRRNSVVLRVNAPRAGMIYASEAHFPGWTAEVNDKTVGIQPANHAFRAVEVPSGPVTVRFEYRPPGLAAGAFVTLLSGLAVVVCLARLKKV